MKTILFKNNFPAIPDKSDPANGAVTLAAKDNSIGSIPPFCLKSLSLRWGPYFLVLPLQIPDFLTATL